MAERRRPARRTAGPLAVGVLGVGLLGTGLATTAPAGAASARDGGSRAAAPHARTWQGDAMRLDRVHRSVTGKGVVIALLDGGIAPDVPALQGAHIEMRKGACSAATDQPVPVLEKGPSSQHGSLMASLLVGGGRGAGGPGTGVMGVAPDATLRFYDIDDADYSTPNTVNCDQVDVVRTARQAIRDGADVVSMSFGDVTETASRAWEQLAADSPGVLVAASIDTDDHPRSFAPPGGVPGIVSVNSLDRAYFPWKKSVTLHSKATSGVQAGWWTPAVAAPGVRLDVPGGAENFGTGAWVTGTSGSTALVAGAIALVKQKYPDATADQLIQNLIHHTTRESMTGSRKSPDMTWALDTGFGAVSIVNMLAHDPAGWPDENPLTIDPMTVAKTYPSSVYGKARASNGASTSAKASPSTGSSGSAGSSGSSGRPDASAKADGSSAGDGGVPSWAWVAVAVLVLLAAGLAATLAGRRRRTTSSTAPPDGSISSGTDDHLTRAGGQ